MFKIKYLDYEFETKEPYEAFAWMVAVEMYDFDSGLAQEISSLVYDLYVESVDINGVELADFICENYHDLPDDYKEIKKEMYEKLLGAW